LGKSFCVEAFKVFGMIKVTWFRFLRVTMGDLCMNFLCEDLF